MINIEDQKIVELYLARNENAIEETKKKYESYVKTIALNILGDPWDAEEAINDAYLDTWNSIPPKCPQMLSTFLGKITRRRAIDLLRKKKAEKRRSKEVSLVFEELEECLCEAREIDEQINADELAKAINRFLKQLPERDQKIFLCRYFYVDSIESISQQFSLGISGVKSSLMRTRIKLKQYLIKEGYL